MSEERPARATLVLLIAQGFGVGRIPVAPGTFGSALGVGCFLLFLASGRVWALILGPLLLAALAIPLCGTAERILAQRDPGSVVMDEIAAMPLCFWSWAMFSVCTRGSLPTIQAAFAGRGWPMIVAGFLAFRLFDVWKPWPVRQSQQLPGGWGVVVDDLLAAGYVNLLTLVLWALGFLH